MRGQPGLATHRARPGRLHPAGAGRRTTACATAALALLTGSEAQAATFASARYDASHNEIVATLNYGGSNPNHQFTPQWGTCQTLGKDGNHQIAVDLIDSQWNDVAQQQYTTTVHVSLANLNCRPAAVTLRTAPKYEFTLQIP